MEKTTNNAGFIIRFFAIKLDSLIFLSLYSLPIYLYLYKTGSIYEIFVGTGKFPPALLSLLTYALSMLFLLPIVKIVYRVYMTSNFGGDLGKILFGLKILDNRNNTNLDTKTAFYRNVAGYAFSTVFLGLGYFAVLKSAENRAWHDELFNTKVVRASTWISGLLAYVVLLAYWAHFVYIIANFVQIY